LIATGFDIMLMHIILHYEGAVSQTLKYNIMCQDKQVSVTRV